VGRGGTAKTGKAKGKKKIPRLVLLTTGGDTSYCDFTYQPGDILLAGRESAGVPDEVREAADAALRVPMVAGMRSLNVALAAAMALGEGLRQTGQFAGGTP